MEKSANRIALYKFRKLSARQQHKVLMALALEWAQGSLDGFLARYHELLEGVSLDRYQAPVWLDDAEQLDSFARFHRLAAGLADDESNEHHLAWQPKYPVELVVDQVRSPYNLGSLVRLIDNLGFERLVYGHAWFPLDHPRFRKTARGSERWIPLAYQPNLPDYLASCGRHVAALELGGAMVPLREWTPKAPLSLVVGHEEHGISDAILALCAEHVAIPMHGNKYSMNVAAACAIAGYHITSRLEGAS
ncbi:MAG: hypothetical protein KDC35_04435 [Acidobacteria bacterium]|nr:hypothetical protein [Acidobacteriota bacterium]